MFIMLCACGEKVKMHEQTKSLSIVTRGGTFDVHYVGLCNECFIEYDVRVKNHSEDVSKDGEKGS